MSTGTLMTRNISRNICRWTAAGCASYVVIVPVSWHRTDIWMWIAAAAPGGLLAVIGALFIFDTLWEEK